ncbi:MAG: flagellar assembly protein FliW [Spirochaetia bacterium]
MRIETKAYGPMEIDERQLITFPAGILGFDTLYQYALLDSERPPFYWLQSLEKKEVAFILIDPFIFRPDYETDVPDYELEELEIESREDVFVFAIVTIPADRNRMTANLQGPLIINKKKRIGKQTIANDPRWKIRHDIMEEMKLHGSNNARTGS